MLFLYVPPSLTLCKRAQVPRLFHYCSLLTERESETEIERLAAQLEREENRIVDTNVTTR